MAKAAVPDYMGLDFSGASPGLRFGMYLQIWQTGFKKENSNLAALKKITSLNEQDKVLMRSLYDRQQSLFHGLKTAQMGMKINALSSAPFVTGLGQAHPLENGFAFLNPYGLPYLPGSGVKGVLRQAARELASGAWGDSKGWNELSINALFGLEEAVTQTQHHRGALSFWDVLPQLKTGRLHIDIMTPHKNHYYHQGEAPHDSENPIPILFLTIPPNTEFTFHVQCNQELLKKIAPDLLNEQCWKGLLKSVFEHAFDWLGFGAKTAVGYGAMRIDTKKEESDAEQQRLLQEEQERAQLPVEQQQLLMFQEKLDNDSQFKGAGLGSQLGEQTYELIDKAKNWSPEWKDEAKKLVNKAFIHLSINRKKGKGKQLWRQLN